MSEGPFRAAAGHSPPRGRGPCRDRPAGRFANARRRVRPRRLPLDGSRRARRARADRAAHAPAHVRRPGADGIGLPPLRARPAGRAGAAPRGVPARASARAVRGGGGAAGYDRDAVAGDEAARARLCSAAPGRDRPARRSADAPAAGRDDGRDHVARRRYKASQRVPGRCGSRAGRDGRRTISTTA